MNEKLQALMLRRAKEAKGKEHQKDVIVDPVKLFEIANKSKDIEYYMNLQYEVKYKKLSKHDGGGWLAYIPLLGEQAYRADGETKKEALKLLNIIKKDLFEDFLEEGLNIPEPTKIKFT